MWTPFISTLLTLSISIAGTINKRDGIGRQSIELGTALKNTYNIQVVPFGECGELSKEEMELVETDLRNLHPIVLLNTSLPEIPHMVEILKRYKKPGQRFLAYTMIESDFVDPRFVEYLNFFEAILVPDPFLVEVFQKSGVKPPIEVIPLAVDLSKFLSKPLKKTLHKPFVFGNFSGCIFRKDQKILLEAFHEEFGSSEEVLLYLFFRGGDTACIKEIRKYIQSHGLKNVKIESGPKPPRAYIEAFESLDCYVSPSWGEGFSIQPREAMALGIPTIVSRNTGQITIADSGLAFVLCKQENIKAVYSLGYNIFNMGNMQRSNKEELKELLKKIFIQKNMILDGNEKLRDWATRYDIERGPFVEEFIQFFEKTFG
ncbi:glycosyltransferase family 1 protein [bacterium]|jgi:glycosyltransferase involved in cell wall biosynthesis|nr:glycosyltransferase family 1 protein [bacterium]